MRSKSRRLGGCIPKAVTSLPSPKAESKGRSQRDGSSAGRTRGEEGMGESKDQGVSGDSGLGRKPG